MISAMATILQINASLGLDTMVGAAVESARELTGARYGIITAFGETGAPALRPRAVL